MKLKTTEERFVAEYIKNGHNGTKAYLAIRPKVSPESAAVSAHRLLNKTSVIKAIQDITDKNKEEAIASKQYLIDEAHEIGKEAKGKEAYGTALKAVEVKAKLNNAYDEARDTETKNYHNLIQFITYGKLDSEEDGKTIDITPEAENGDK